MVLKKIWRRHTLSQIFIHKGFKTGVIDMMTDGTEMRDFLYAEDCCEGLEAIMNNYQDLSSDDELHITTGIYTSILEIANEIKKLFSNIGKDVIIKPAQSKDEVQRDARNIADPFINERFWQAKTSVQDGFKKKYLRR